MLCFTAIAVQDVSFYVAIADAAVRARELARLTPKQMADAMGISQQVLDRQLRPSQYPGQHLSIYRLSMLPWGFHEHFVPLYLACVGKHLVGAFEPTYGRRP